MKILFLFLLIASTAFAQSSARFTITRNIMAGGGTTASSQRAFQLGEHHRPAARCRARQRAVFPFKADFGFGHRPLCLGPPRWEPIFCCPSRANLEKTYTLQYVNALGSSWQNLPPITGNGNIITVTNSAAKAQRFYRLLEQ